MSLIGCKGKSPTLQGLVTFAEYQAWLSKVGWGIYISFPFAYDVSLKGWGIYHDGKYNIHYIGVVI